MEEQSFWKELIKLAVITAVIVIPFRLFIAQPFIVDGASMSPTFETGHYLIIDELSYRFETPPRGSVIVFKYPKDTSVDFIKRVIGLPNETVKIDHGTVSIVNAEHPEGFTLDEPYVKLPKDETATYELSAGEYFVMGDNRAESADSRFWGPLPTKDIIGRPIIRLWPFSIWPGNANEEN